MDRDEKKKLFEEFGMSYWGEYETEDFLLAIMSKLVNLEKRIEQIASPHQHESQLDMYGKLTP